MREIHFNIAFILATVGLVVYLINGGVNLASVTGQLGGVAFSVSILLGVAFGLQKFLYNTKFDIQQQIYENQNIAAAIYQVGIWIALAMVISKGIM